MTISSGPPRFVPTLTDIVQAGQPDVMPVDDQPPTALKADAFVLEEQIIHRVMQRIDLTLDRRLREALGQVILTQTQNLAPLLREEIELVVREAVSQAVAQEFV